MAAFKGITKEAEFGWPPFDGADPCHASAEIGTLTENVIGAKGDHLKPRSSFVSASERFSLTKPVTEPL